MTHFLARAEDYPELKADGTFRECQVAIQEAETHLAAARRSFNAASMEYNSFRRQFPINLVAGLLGFDAVSAFQANEESRGRPDIATY